jgi:hypothetical protein
LQAPLKMCLISSKWKMKTIFRSKIYKEDSQNG